MIKITVIALGRLKERYLSAAVEEYSKRLSRYCDLKICEIEPVKLPEKPSDGEIANALEKEAELIFKHIPSGNKIIPLCVEGKPFSSPQLASEIKNQTDMGRGITFIIGSSYGLSESVKRAGDLRLSMSAMTFPHQLFRVMLLEQIYRGFKINEGSAYHK